MAARLGNVIYWACCGVAVLWLVAMAAYVVSDDRGPFAPTHTFEFSSPQRRSFKVEAPRSLSRDYVVELINESAIKQTPDDPWPGRRIGPATSAEWEDWLTHHSSIGFNTGSLLTAALLLGLIPAMLVWLFGRACRYVLAG
jgi:hypothetical protein